MVSLKEFLKSKLTKRELSELHSSFDIIGNRDKAVAIVQIPEKLEKKKKFVAQGIMKLHPNVKSVLQKLSGREEEYRLNQFKLIGGDKNTEVVHKEFGLRLKLDPQKVYFSPRESTERLRVTNQVKRGETVMVFFAGAGPYVCLIGRKTRASRIIGIEINPHGYEHMKENIRLNKLVNAEAILGNVREDAKPFYGKCDRVVMPVRFAHEFLNEAFACLKKKGTIHFYHVAPEEDLYSEAVKFLRVKAKKYKRKIKILAKHQVHPYAPRVWKICIDAQVRFTE